MNAIDGTDRHIVTEGAPPPSLLAIVLDTNPHAWAELHSTLPLSSALSALLVFINAHLASGNANEIVVIASHTNCAEWLYPSPRGPYPSSPTTEPNGNSSEARHNKDHVPGDPNKFRPFSLLEHSILTSLSRLVSSTTSADLASTPTTSIGGALSLALTYMSKAALLREPVANDAANANPLSALADSESATTTRTTLTSRILILSVSGDLANQYIPVMNCIFAAQRRRIPIDIVKLAGDTVLLQQASDATGGVYVKPERPEGLLQYLMMAFLPDATSRRSLVMPTAGGVDFRAACFCHRNVVDIGYVCSVCLSIFCSPTLQDNLCLTCGSYLSLRSATSKTPQVIPRKKKKKKRLGTDSATPGPSAVGTPMHG
ncbi:transcription factor Tfb4 [Amniculicola lignicola CBS 123094]|uniref:General transcription and DNA repair factor IIH subunit TFB4 n=1 Tax=Amniculicola lignicola CBS 123094 TaxID=1392246 RepID=A0A6A5WM23_9PLEO|nr:transcription factor Tfb4 [Amniculicola lignicola CBS 123094]